MMSGKNNDQNDMVSEENHADDTPNDELKQTKDIFTHNSNIIVTNCAKVNSTIYFGQLPPLKLPAERDDTGGVLFEGDIAYGKLMAPMWIVTSYRLAIN